MQKVEGSSPFSRLWCCVSLRCAKPGMRGFVLARRGQVAMRQRHHQALPERRIERTRLRTRVWAIHRWLIGCSRPITRTAFRWGLRAM
jgi:hypothetical protein